jgi:hypothetical protein
MDGPSVFLCLFVVQNLGQIPNLKRSALIKIKKNCMIKKSSNGHSLSSNA